MQKLIGALLGVLISITTFAQDPSKEGSSALSALFSKPRPTALLEGRIGQEAYTMLLAQDPTHETALYQLTHLLYRKQFPEAEQLLATGTSAYPENQWMWRLQAVNARQLGDMATAFLLTRHSWCFAPTNLNMYKMPFKVRLLQATVRRL